MQLLLHEFTSCASYVGYSQELDKLQQAFTNTAFWDVLQFSDQPKNCFCFEDTFRQLTKASLISSVNLRAQGIFLYTVYMHIYVCIYICVCVCVCVCVCDGAKLLQVIFFSFKPSCRGTALLIVLIISPLCTFYTCIHTVRNIKQQQFM